MKDWRNWAWIAMMILLPIGACIDTNDGDAGLEPGVHPIMGSEDWYKEKIAELEAKVSRQDSCLVMCHEQAMLTYNWWRECVNQPKLLKPWIDGTHIANGLRLRHFADDYDSVVVIDSIIYERAAGSRTAANNGVMRQSK